MRIEGTPTPPKEPSDKIRGLEKFRKPKTSEEVSEAVEDVGEVAVEHEVSVSSSEPHLRGLEKFRKRERDSTVRHAPTWELEFGKYGTGHGSLEADGFEALNSNHSSSQDAFAVSEDRRRFAVADGMGGSGADHEATRFLAKFVSDQAVERGIDTFFDAVALAELYKQAEDLFEAETGRRFESPATGMVRSSMLDTAATTLTFAEILGRTGESTSVRIVTIGDSPAFVTDEKLKPVKQFGEDAQSGETDAPLAYSLGVKADGTPKIPEKGKIKDGKYVVDEIIEIPTGSYLLLGTDYFSDTVHFKGRFGHLADFAGLSPDEYSRKVRSTGKPDDATLVVVEPSKIT